MNKGVKSFISFTRTERIGLICLFVCIVMLIGIRTCIHFWVHPATDEEENRRLVAAWETYKSSMQQPIDGSSSAKNDYVDTLISGATSLPAVINVNTADSATLVRLIWIGPVTAHKIIDRRKNIGPFTNMEQVRALCRFNPGTFEALKKHLSVANN